MSIRPRKKIDIKISQNKAYQVILKPLVTEKSSLLSEYKYLFFFVTCCYDFAMFCYNS